MEKIHTGQFTIPFIEKYFTHIRIKLSNEVCKVKVEEELFIRNLIINYRLIISYLTMQLLFFLLIQHCIISVPVPCAFNRLRNKPVSLPGQKTFGACANKEFVMESIKC